MLDSAAALMSKVSKNCAISRLHGSARKIVAMKKIGRFCGTLFCNVPLDYLDFYAQIRMVDN